MKAYIHLRKESDTKPQRSFPVILSYLNSETLQSPLYIRMTISILQGFFLF